MKLHLEITEGEKKVERDVELPPKLETYHSDINNIVDNMIDTLQESKKPL